LSQKRGTGMAETDQPHLLLISGPANGPTIAAITNGLNARYFDNNGLGGYTSRFFLQETLTHSGTTYVLTDTLGNYQYLSDSTGLITTYDYTSSGPVGYLLDVKIQQGELGATTKLEQWVYVAQSTSLGTIYKISSDTVYRNTDGTGDRPEQAAYQDDFRMLRLKQVQQGGLVRAQPGDAHRQSVRQSVVSRQHFG
jgi:hypothetical protein